MCDNVFDVLGYFECFCFCFDIFVCFLFYCILIEVILMGKNTNFSEGHYEVYNDAENLGTIEVQARMEV